MKETGLYDKIMPTTKGAWLPNPMLIAQNTKLFAQRLRTEKFYNSKLRLVEDAFNKAKKNNKSNNGKFKIDPKTPRKPNTQ